MKFIKFLQITQLFVTFAATSCTPVDESIYGFYVFVIGWLYALLNLTIPRRRHHQKNLKICNKNEEFIIEKQKQPPKESVLLIALESAHDYIPIGFINIELHEKSFLTSQLSFMFCIPFGLDILSRLFADGIKYVVDERLLMFLKNINILLHSLSILSLGVHQYNIWFGAIWLSAMIVFWGVYSEISYSSTWKNLKLFGYILFYIFAFMAIYDKDFLKRLEWINERVQMIV